MGHPKAALRPDPLDGGTRRVMAGGRAQRVGGVLGDHVFTSFAAAPHVTSKHGIAMPRIPALATIPPRGLNIRQAAAYWGVSSGTFRKLIRLGLVPEPLRLPGLDRNIYDPIALDAAMSALAAAVTL
jgi:hypothetical protein